MITGVPQQKAPCAHMQDVKPAALDVLLLCERSDGPVHLVGLSPIRD